MSGSPESIVVAAGVGATFHLFRFAADLISHASSYQSIEEKNDGKTDEADDTVKTKNARRSNNRSSMTRVFNGRLSMGRNLNQTSLALSNQFNKASTHGNRNPTATGIGLGISEHTAQSLEAGVLLTIPEEEPKKGLEKHIPVLSTVLHLLLLPYFITMCVLTSIKNPAPAFQDPLYGGVALGCAAAAMLIALLMNVRDFHRTRFSSLQRVTSTMGALILLVGCIVALAFSPTQTNSKPTSIDWATLSALFCHTLLILTEGHVCRYPVPVVSSDDDTTEGKKVKLSRSAILTILKPYFWPSATGESSALLNRFRVIVTWLCVGAAKTCNLVAPIFLGKASTALSRLDYRDCIKYSISYAVIQFCGSFFKECQSLVYLRVAQAAFVQLATVAFEHLHSLSLDWHLRKKLGNVIRSMDRGIAACDILMKYMFLWLIPALAECIAVCVIFAVYFDYFPLSVSVFFFVFVYIVWTVVLTLWRKKFRKQVAKSDNDWHDRCTDSLMNFETVKHFTNEEYEIQRFRESIETYQSGNVNVAASLSALNISQQLILQTCLATSLSLAAIGIKQRMDCCIANGCDEVANSQCCSDLGGICQGMEIGDFVAVLSYTLNLFMPLNFLGSVYNAIVMAIVDLTNLSELLAESPDITDNVDAVPLPSTNASDSDPDIAVEFDNVRFHYPTQSDKKGLKGVSFKLKRGTVTAIVGPTGAGKSTITRLLFRFYDVIGGAVKVNGMDIRAITQESLRGVIGVVPQSTSLFNDTIRANISYSKLDATQEELDQVAEDAQLTNFIDALPDGWDTQVGDRGLKLSGGELQRTAIARCLLKNPPFVVLDEATSALDTITENSVQEALDRLGTRRTCLVIAHRLGTIRNADNIIVLDDGQVVEEGTHDELLALDGKYAEMWKMQLHSTRDANGSDHST